MLILRDGTHKKGRITKLTAFEGLKREEVDRSVGGRDRRRRRLRRRRNRRDLRLGRRIPSALEPIAIDEPTVSMFWLVNDSPFAGTEGKYVTSRNIKERLERELRKDVALRVQRDRSARPLRSQRPRRAAPLDPRREHAPRRLRVRAVASDRSSSKKSTAARSEPYEALVVDIDEAHVGAVMEKLQTRRGEMTDMVNPGSGRVRIEFKIPTRGLFGIRTEFLTETRGTGLLYHTFLEYGPYRGEIAGRNRGALISKEGGDTTAYAIEPLQERTVLFIAPGMKVYGGQIVGENSRDADMVVQVCRKKHLTNMRASGSDMAVQLTPAEDHDPRAMPRMDRRRRAGRSDPAVDPHPQDGSSITRCGWWRRRRSRRVARKRVKRAAALPGRPPALPRYFGPSHLRWTACVRFMATEKRIAQH